jgi:hypothetical protein
MTNNRRDLVPAAVEPLEHRTLLSAAPSFNLYNLMYTKKLGASWTYDGSFDVSGDASDSGSGTVTVGVLSKPKTFDGHLGTQVYTNSNGVDAKLGFYRDADGLHASALVNVSDFGTLSVSLKGTVLAPPTLTGGGPASRAGGTFTGTLSFDGDAISAEGTISGNATVRSQLLKTQKVTVAAGTFNTVKGTTTIALDGTLKIRAGGQTFNADYSATIAQTFWAAADVGVVKFNSTSRIGASGDGESASVRIDADGALTSYHKPKASAPNAFAAAVAPATVARSTVSHEDDEVPVFA